MFDFAVRTNNAVSHATLLLGRIAMSAIFLPSGLGKLMALGDFAATLASRGVPFPHAFAVIGACVEFFGALAVLLGIRLRYAAALMALFTIIAALISHRFWDFQDAARSMQYVNFMKNVAIAGGFLVLLAAGPGCFSLDRLGRAGRDLSA